MKDLSPKAQLYIWIALIASTGLMVWHLTRLSISEPWLLIVAAGVAAVAQILKVEGSTNRSSYNISWLVFGFIFAVQGVPAAIVVILVAHIVEWIWHRYPWYIQLFNIATYVLALQGASLVYSPSLMSHDLLNPATTLSLLAAMAIFTLINHLMVGIVIWLARGETLATSGVFGRLTLMIDFSLLCLGTAAAFIWSVNALAVVLTLIPLYLIYSTLRVPALERQTDTDPKTGLFNMRYFNKAVEKEMARAQRDGHALTIVVGDLDLLRNINNTYGHLAGDAVLLNVAQTLQKSLRAYDVVARFGGEEFAILMPEIAPEQAIGRVEAIRAAIASAEFQVPTSVTPIQVTMSFGIAGLARPDQPATEIMHNADIALYSSKLSGRNRASIYAETGGHTSFNTGVPRSTEDDSKAGSEPSPLSDLAESPRGSGPGSAGPISAPVFSKRPPWLINIYITILAACALGLLTVFLRSNASADWLGIGIFAVMLLLTEWLSVEIFVKDTSVSTADVPFVAGILLFGPAGALVLSLALAVTAMIKNRSPLSRLIFNASNHLISGLLCLGLVRLAAGTVDVQALPVLFGLAVVSAIITYLSSTLLIALAIDFDTGQSARRVWSERFLWLAPVYLGMGLVSFALIFSYRGLGLVGALTIVVPLAVLRFSQKQFVDRTTTMVSELKKANQALVTQTTEVSTLNDDLLTTLANAVDQRDPYVAGHSRNVARYAVLVAKELRLPRDQVEVIHKAGLLHDIGKLHVPDKILFKPGPLTAEELDVVKQHPQRGAEILANSHALLRYIPAVLHHHERYDGLGYPNQLSGEDIPLEARVLALADAVEAMASDRPYRQSRDASAVLAELQAASGTQFDPVIVRTFLAVIQKTGAKTIVNSSLDVNLRIKPLEPAITDVVTPGAASRQAATDNV